MIKRENPHVVGKGINGIYFQLIPMLQQIKKMYLPGRFNVYSSLPQIRAKCTKQEEKLSYNIQQRDTPTPLIQNIVKRLKAIDLILRGEPRRDCKANSS